MAYFLDRLRHSHVIGLLALPESPRILLQIGHESETLVIYQVHMSSRNKLDEMYTTIVS